MLFKIEIGGCGCSDAHDAGHADLPTQLQLHNTRDTYRLAPSRYVHAQSVHPLAICRGFSDRLLVFAANPWSPVALPHLQQEATKKSESKRVGKEIRKVGPQEMSTENNADYYDYVKFASDLCTQPVYFSLRSNFSPRRSQNQLLLGWQPFF